VLELGRDGLLYLDTSALVKLVIDEDESPALRDELTRWDDGRFATSALTRVELPRAVTRAVPTASIGDALQVAAAVLESTQIIPLTDQVIALAAGVGPSALRSLDAIHLASALVASPAEVRPVLCGYDQRLQEAGREQGLLAISPT
jgi:predicted nucleic acid-binding protein